MIGSPDSAVVSVCEFCDFVVGKSNSIFEVEDNGFECAECSVLENL